MIEKLLLKKLRKSLGLRQEDMAREIGISRQLLSLIENGKAPLTAKVRVKIEEALGRLNDRKL